MNGIVWWGIFLTTHRPFRSDGLEKLDQGQVDDHMDVRFVRDEMTGREPRQDLNGINPTWHLAQHAGQHECIARSGRIHAGIFSTSWVRDPSSSATRIDSMSRLVLAIFCCVRAHDRRLAECEGRRVVVVVVVVVVSASVGSLLRMNRVHLSRSQQSSANLMNGTRNSSNKILLNHSYTRFQIDTHD